MAKTKLITIEDVIKTGVESESSNMRTFEKEEKRYPGRNKKPADVKLTERVASYFTKEEKKIIDKIAQEEMVSASLLLRKLLLRYIAKE
ncbi:MAG: hypothetical protein LBP57_00075 [Endomicrobium sp.]|jgi:hypothetical protein|nr:hypothetical protein [Endomicrobium sp.]